MIKIKLSTQSNKEIFINSFIKLEFNANRYIPANSLLLVIPLVFEKERIFEITAYLDDDVFFNGIVDRQIIEKTSGGSFLKLECRNKTAMLLDNEVKPYQYDFLSNKQVLNIFLNPFGINDAVFPFDVTLGNFIVTKGSSYYNVVEKFCLEAYKKQPYINNADCLLINTLNDTIHTFSNELLQYNNYSKLIIKHLYDKIVSKIFIKTAHESNNFFYGLSVDNQNLSDKKVVRERFLNPQNSSNENIQELATRIIDTSNKNSFLIELYLPYLFKCSIGDQVIIKENESYDNLYISSINYTVSNKLTEETKLILSSKLFE